MSTVRPQCIQKRSNLSAPKHKALFCSVNHREVDGVCGMGNPVMHARARELSTAGASRLHVEAALAEAQTLLSMQVGGAQMTTAHEALQLLQASDPHAKALGLQYSLQAGTSEVVYDFSLCRLHLCRPAESIAIQMP